LFCTKCGVKIIDESIKFCPKCGESTFSSVSKKENNESNSNTDKPKKKGRSKKKKLGIGVGVLILLFFIGLSIPSDTDTPTSKTNPTATNEQPKEKSYNQMSDIELANIQVDWEYRDLLRNIDDYSGKIIFVDGKVTNVQRDLNSINLCTHSTTVYSVFSCEEFMFVSVNGINTWLEDDQLTGFVKVEQLKETGTKNALTKGEWVGSGNFVPEVVEITLTCSNC
jgi:predicted  nucleic acid-binding Zn-ribbon protein